VVVALRFSVAVVLLSGAACGTRSPLETPEPSEQQVTEPVDDPRPPDPNPVLPTKPQPPDPNPQPPLPPPPQQQAALIGGCAQLCEGGCSHPGLVVGTRLDTGEIVIPVDIVPDDYKTAGGLSCGVDLPLGTELMLEARVEPGFRFVRWMDSVSKEALGWGPCPCTDSTDPICFLIVSESVYCGGAYALR
jgi:hypothetical protein